MDSSQMSTQRSFVFGRKFTKTTFILWKEIVDHHVSPQTGFLSWLKYTSITFILCWVGMCEKMSLETFLSFGFIWTFLAFEYCPFELLFCWWIVNVISASSTAYNIPLRLGWTLDIAEKLKTVKNNGMRWNSEQFARDWLRYVFEIF